MKHCLGNGITGRPTFESWWNRFVLLLLEATFFGCRSLMSNKCQFEIYVLHKDSYADYTVNSISPSMCQVPWCSGRARLDNVRGAWPSGTCLVGFALCNARNTPGCMSLCLRQWIAHWKTYVRLVAGPCCHFFCHVPPSVL